MVVTLADLLSLLRIALNDSETPPLMSDGALAACINAGIRMATTEVPFDSSEEFTADGKEYDLPDYCVKVHRVSLYVDGALTFWNTGGHRELSGVWGTGDEPQVVLVHFPSHGRFYLPYEPPSDFTLYYAARRQELTLAEEDEELGEDETDTIDLGHNAWMQWAILAFAAYYAFNPRSAFRADLEQWAMKIDLNVDNPLEQEGRRWLKEYQRIIQTYAQPPVFEAS